MPLISPDRESEQSGFCTSCGALSSGLENTDRGYDAGLKRGAVSYFASPMMEQLSLEITVNRIAIEAMSQAAEQMERLLSHWKAEAAWWKEEHDRVHDEYCATVADLARRFGK